MAAWAGLKDLPKSLDLVINFLPKSKSVAIIISCLELFKVVSIIPQQSIS